MGHHADNLPGGPGFTREVGNVLFQIVVREAVPGLQPVPLRFGQIFPCGMPGGFELFDLVRAMAPSDLAVAKSDAAVDAFARRNMQNKAMDRTIGIQIVRPALRQNRPGLTSP